MDSDRLDSWKEIAAYLRRDVATVRRWETREGLPVHRHQHTKLGSVYANRPEIDAWRAERELRKSRPAAETIPLLPPPSGDQGLVGRRSVRWTIALVLVAMLAGLGWAGLQWARIADVPLFSFFLTPPTQAQIHSLTISPDGTRIAFAAAVAGQPSMLWLRPLKSTTPQFLPGTDHASFPFWSPDGRQLGFFADRKLKRIDLATNSVEVIGPAPDGRGGTWSQTDVIVFSPTIGRGLSRVSIHEGVVAALTTVTRAGAEGHQWPEFLPDGRHVLYYVDSPDPDRQGVYVVGLDTTESRRVLAVASNALYSADGHLLFIRGRQLLAQAFDVDRLQIAGEPVVLAEPVLQQHALVHKGDFSVSRTGLLSYRIGAVEPSPLVWFNRNGTRGGNVGEPSHYGAPVLSPDETRVAAVRFDHDPGASTYAAIWTVDLQTGASTRLTADPRPNFMPLWSPNGAQIMFASQLGTSAHFIQKASTGVDADRVVFTASPNVQPEEWSQDGRYIFFADYDRATGYDTWALPLFGAGKPFPVLRGRFWESQSQLSPNGQLLSYTSNESGRLEVYVTRFPSREGTWKISDGGGGDARWRKDSHELFYIGADGQMMSVAIGASPRFDRGVPQRLFDTGIEMLWEDMRNHYDVTGDGQRFLMTVPVDRARSGPYTVTNDWTRPVR